MKRAPFPYSPLLLLLLLLLILISQHLTLPSTSALDLPLSTSGRWIVDMNGQRIKLACINWPAHLEPMVAEGLNKRPLNLISADIASMGFNCVRLTWPLHLVVADGTGAMITVRQSLQRLGLDGAVAGVRENNPWILDLNLIQAFKAVVLSLGRHRIMAILDNHISRPGWCCNNYDGNGFFGDQFFNPEEWIKGLAGMARLFKGVTNVVGMSLRNELRGPKQNAPDWYRYMQMGAEAVHGANPDVLVILSGLSFSTDLSFLSTQKVQLTFTDKLVHELHWYSFTDGGAWDWNANDACASITSSVMNRAGFILDQGLPLFLSEWGVDQRGENGKDNRYLGCVMAVAAELDVDWSLWALQGSYYLREGVVDMEEMYGVLSSDWERHRNPRFLQRIASLQSPFQGPGLGIFPQYIVLYHPASGSCIGQDDWLNSPLRLGSCDAPRGWTYTPQKTIQFIGAVGYLKESGPGQRVMLVDESDDQRSKWDLISESKMHISSRSGSNLCLDVGSDGSTLVTNPCRCLSRDEECDPQSQWFRLVPRTRPILQSIIP